LDVTSVDRTAYPRFGRVVSGRELADSFTPTDAEAEWVRARTQDQPPLLALTVLLKSYQRLAAPKKRKPAKNPRKKTKQTG
jgi:hypothetical protein